jgi:hypothetical protein
MRFLLVRKPDEDSVTTLIFSVGTLIDSTPPREVTYPPGQVSACPFSQGHQPTHIREVFL